MIKIKDEYKSSNQRLCEENIALRKENETQFSAALEDARREIAELREEVEVRQRREEEWQTCAREREEQVGRLEEELQREKARFGREIAGLKERVAGQWSEVHAVHRATVEMCCSLQVAMELRRNCELHCGREMSSCQC